MDRDLLLYFSSNKKKNLLNECHRNHLQNKQKKVVLHATGSKPVMLLDKGSGKCSKCQWVAGRLESPLYRNCVLLNTQNSHI